MFESDCLAGHTIARESSPTTAIHDDLHYVSFKRQRIEYKIAVLFHYGL